MPDSESLSCLYNGEAWPPDERIDKLLNPAPSGAIFLVGVCHDFQYQDVSDEFRHDQARLSDLLEKLIVKYKVRLIGEEQEYVRKTEKPRKTIATSTAERHDLLIHNLDVREEDFKDKYVPFSRDKGTYYFAWNLVREWHMYEMFCSEMKGERSALLICGLSHLPPLQHLLRNRYGGTGWTIIPICLQPSEQAKQCRDCCWFARSLELGNPRINVPPGYELGEINF
jgi:hypothetical protein